jgi:hypothetical protein
VIYNGHTTCIKTRAKDHDHILAKKFRHKEKIIMEVIQVNHCPACIERGCVLLEQALETSLSQRKGMEEDSL